MEKDIIGAENKNIPANMSRIIKYTDGKWTTAKQDGSFHLYNAFNNGDSGDVKKHKLSVFGLILSFNQNSGGLDLLPPDYEASKSFFTQIFLPCWWEKLLQKSFQKRMLPVKCQVKEHWQKSRVMSNGQMLYDLILQTRKESVFILLRQPKEAYS